MQKMCNLMKSRPLPKGSHNYDIAEATSNLKLLESSLSMKMKIKAGACESIKGKIIDAKQTFSFGPMSIMS